MIRLMLKTVSVASTLLLFAAACSKPPDVGIEQSANESQVEEAVSEVDQRFRKQLAAALSSNVDSKSGMSAYDRRCPYSFSRGLLLDYLDAAVKGETIVASGNLLKIYSQLKCVSAARFRDTLLSFKVAAFDQRPDEPEHVQRKLDEALAPILFLLFDMGSAPLREELYPWLLIKFAELKLELRDPLSAVRTIGMYANHDDGLIQLDANEIQRLQDSLVSTAWMSGRCSAKSIERVIARTPRGTDVEIPYCPDDCKSQDDDSASFLDVRLSSADAAEGSALRPEAAGRDGEPAQELEDVCRSARDQADALAASSTTARVQQCLEDFGDRNQQFMSCIINKRLSASNSLFDLSTGTTRAQEVVVGRACKLSQQSPTGAVYPHARSEEQPCPVGGTATCPDGGSVRRRYSTSFSSDGTELKWVGVERTYDADGDLVQQKYVEVTDDGVVEVVTDYNEAGESKTSVVYENPEGEIVEEHCAGITDCLSAAETGSGSAGQCSLEQQSCATNCSINDQIAQELLECPSMLFDGSPDGVAGVGPDPDPDPRATMPNPETVGALDPEVEGLVECLMDAMTGDTEEVVGQNDCRSHLRCPDMDWPRGENCTCLPSQRFGDGARMPDQCDRMRCDQHTDTCPCDRLRALFDDEQSSDGERVPRVRVLGELELR